jgi:hypothetical protein
VRFIATAMGFCAFAGIAVAGPITEKLRSCLTIEDMTKERLDCYDSIVPPAPKPKPPPAKIITDCKFLKEEDQRLKCFNRFLEMPQRPSTTVVPLASPAPAMVRSSIRPVYVRHGRGGCGSRGGAGYRLPNGRCAGRKH